MKHLITAVLSATIIAARLYAAGPGIKECPMAKAKKCSGTCPEKMEGVLTVSKNIPGGVEIIMTARDKETAAKAQELALVHYNSPETMEKGCPALVEGAEIKLTNTLTGVTVEITGKTAGTVKKIQAASLKEHKQAGISRGSEKNAQEAKAPAGYACPMGCPIGESDKQGKCPNCRTDLREKR